jgi:hypothetical protein
MSDTYEPDEESQEELNPRDLRAQLAQRAKEADELRAQLEATKRDAEFTKALGNDADAPWVKYFQKGYDGDINAEAIRQAATEAGFLTPINSEAPQRQFEDLSGHARMAANAAGGSGAGKVDWTEALAEADRIPDPVEREAAILSVVERYGGVTSRTAQ